MEAPVLVSIPLLFMQEISKVHHIVLRGEKSPGNLYNTAPVSSLLTECWFLLFKHGFGLEQSQYLKAAQNITFLNPYLSSAGELGPVLACMIPMNPSFFPFYFVIFASVSPSRKPSGLHLCCAKWLKLKGEKIWMCWCTLTWTMLCLLSHRNNVVPF